MPITPLPQFEADLKAYVDERDRAAYDALKAPTTIVIRFGRLKLIGEYPYRGDSKPGCGSKLVARTHRGTELGEMLTSTCPNAGCAKSVTRKDMLEYIDNSGGRDFPFYSNGRILRVATSEDLNLQAQHEQMAHAWKVDARERAQRLSLDMKIVDAEMILGKELLTFFYTSEQRVDFRELIQQLAAQHATRIEMRQVGARDEARLTADYERCGQYCCCKNFLKVLKPVSMRSAKIQKATLDPLKISGRCGRLMCCLRYEDQTYADLKKNLPNRKTKVGTPDGDGIVIDSQILTQLVLVRLDADGRDVAIPVEELGEPGKTPAREQPEPVVEQEYAQPTRTQTPDETRADDQPDAQPEPRRRRKRRRRRRPGDRQDAPPAPQSSEAPETSSRPPQTNQPPKPKDESAEGKSRMGGPRKRRRRRRRRGGSQGDSGPADTGDSGS
jgi:cell fate regulator YaaT (PSP1 superfamily)